MDQVRQGAALKELSRAIYEDRLGDNLSEGMREREEVKDPSIPVSGIWGGVAVQEDGESAKRICQWDKFSSGQINNSIGQGGKSSGRCRSNPMTL